MTSNKHSNFTIKKYRLLNAERSMSIPKNSFRWRVYPSLFINVKPYMRLHSNKAKTNLQMNNINLTRPDQKCSIDDYQPRQTRMETNIQAGILNHSKINAEPLKRTRMLPNGNIKRNKSKCKVESNLCIYGNNQLNPAPLPHHFGYPVQANLRVDPVSSPSLYYEKVWILS